MFERSVRLVILWLRSHKSNTGLAELLYISVEVGPGIFAANEFQYFVLTRVSSKDMVIIILENVYMEITSG